MATIEITASNNRVAASTGDVVLLPLIGDAVTDSVWITVSGSVTLRPSGTDKIDGTQGDVTLTQDSQYTNTGSASWYVVNPATVTSGFVTLDTVQTITAAKTFTGDITLSGISNSLNNFNFFNGFNFFQQEAYMRDGVRLYFFPSGNANWVRVETAVPSANYTLTIPALSANSTLQAGFSLTSAAMTAGTVVISDSRFKTGDIIQCTRKSGAGASTGLKSVTIVDSTSCTLEANAATDDGVWYVTVTKP